MIKKLLKTFCIIVACTGILQAQNEAAIKIKLIDKVSKVEIPFASVIVESGGIQVAGGTSNIDGELVIKPLNPGKYNVKATSVGYQPIEISNVSLSVGKTSYLNVEMIAGQELGPVEVVEWKKPLIDPDTKSGGTVDRTEFLHMATKSINAVASTTAGVYQADEGKDINIRGARTDATAYYVDGQKIVGNAGLGIPQGSIDQVTTIVGGTPAEYGDAVGGVISITTRGPESKYSGGIEVSTSGAGLKNGKQMGLDAFGYNYVGFSFNGPLLFKKDTSKSGFKKALLGFSINGQVTYEKDPSGPATDYYQIKSDKLKELQNDPVRLNPNGNGYVLNSQYVTMADMERVKARNNVDSRGISLSAKLVYQPTTNLGITLFGSVDDAKNKRFIYQSAMFNYENNPRVHNITWRTYAKITQKFNAGTKEEQEKSSSIIKNAYFTLQGSFLRYQGKTEPGAHGDNYFDYGYVGKFDQKQQQAYVYERRKVYSVDGDTIPDDILAYWQNGFTDVSYKFTPGDKNPNLTAYTNQYYAITDPARVRSIYDVENGLGLGNGDQPNSVYAIWDNTGTVPNFYTKFQNDAFRVFANFSADIKNHAIQVGMEYEQRNESSYVLYAQKLWTLMRQLANNDRLNLDDKGLFSAILNQDSTNGEYYDFKRLYSGNQSKFARSLRTTLGLDTAGTDVVNVDQYDPSMYKLNMFSAKDLLNEGGTQYVSYNGYDHTGKKLNGTASLDDFFNQVDDQGYNTHITPAYKPIYIAGYIQDKFDFKDLKFNIGLRVDRFDANQKVLKDPYLLFDAKTVGELRSDPKFHAPANIGDDFIPYVKNISDPNVSDITGYRHGDTWYDANGTVVDDPATAITGTAGGIYPYLVDPTKTKATQINSKAFKDYEPQVNFMPRIAFAFPISDVANFFAHYDVLTQRPSSITTRMDPFSYLNMSNDLSGYIRNPNLKPERTTDYELGFTQVLTERKNSALTLSAFYRELRNQIQTARVYQAYPNTYNSYKNVDFGTIKGFSIAYDLRRLSSGVQLNANYTLQFADGTGSAYNDGQNIVAAGQPNIRVPHALDYDQRHTITINMDYRFGSGADYNGPMYTRKKGDKEKTSKILENVGANLTFRLGSGTPYSRQSNVTPEGQFGLNINKSLEGAVNGSNLPWSYKIDLRIDKSMSVYWGKKDGENKRKQSNLNIYLQVLNVLNTKNIIKVYKATGNANDDGYLSAASSQNTIASQINPNSFVDLYSLKINDPANFSRPRVIRIGLQLDF